MARNKDATGLEWLLREAEKPDPHAPKTRVDPVEAALGAETGEVDHTRDSVEMVLDQIRAVEEGSPESRDPDPWEVAPLAGTRAKLPLRGSMSDNALDAILLEATPVVENASAPEPAAGGGEAPPPSAPAVIESSTPAMAVPATGDAPRARAESVAAKGAVARDRRSKPRAKADFSVRFRKGSEAVVAPGRNVSAGGFFVETTRFLQQGDVFQAQLTFDAPEARRMSVIGEVVWGSMGDPDTQAPPGMGIKLLDVDDKDAPFLAALPKS